MIWLDFETRSRCDLKTRGVYNYARDDSTQVLCMSYAIDDGDVRTWTRGPLPNFDGHLIYAHNAAFERLIFQYVLDLPMPPERFVCTAAQARSNCLPGSLEDIGRAVSSNMRKDFRGSQLIRRMCVPPFEYTPELMAALIQYCEQDVRAMRAISKALRPLSAEELADYHVNERINDRGVMLDLPLAEAAVRYAAAETTEIQDIVCEVTQREIVSVRSTRMKDWVWDRVGPQSQKLMTLMKKNRAHRCLDKTVRASLLVLAEEDPTEVPPDVADVIQCADDLWASSVAKFNRLAGLADEDDRRVRGAFVFAGGGATGRAASYGAQVHNFTRKCAKDPDAVRAAMVASAPIVPQFGRRVTDVLKGMLRPALVPAHGKMFFVADWVGIEARMNPWLSGKADEVLEVFRTGQDIYIREAEKIFNTHEINAAQRQVGKVAVLACFGAETQVLTDNGVKAIVEVKLTDKLWDGESWVDHQGPIFRGLRTTINVCGTEVTPDHLVRTNQTWIPARQLVSNKRLLIRALAFGSASLPSWASKSVTKACAGYGLSGFNARAVLNRIWFTYTTFLKAPLRAATYALKNLPGFGEKVFTSTPTLALTTSIGGDCLIGSRLAKIDATIQKTEAIQITAGAGSRYILNGAPINPRSCDMYLRLMGGINRIWNWTESTSIRVMSRTICGLLLGKKTVATNDQSKTCSDTSQNLKPVFDILNSGKNNRFTVLTNAGALIVHNCGYGGGYGAFKVMAKTYGIQTTEEEARKLVTKWRHANRWAVDYWSELEIAYLSAMKHPGQDFQAARVVYNYDGTHLWYDLPSGRRLCYPFARLNGDEVSYLKSSWKPAADAVEWPRHRLWKGLACIAKGTPVLTDEGWVAIEDVPQSAKVWDGQEWVSQEGVVPKGVGRVSSVFGVSMTAEHLVLTTKGWLRADQIQGHYRAACWVPLRYESHWFGWAAGYLGDCLRLWANSRDEIARLYEIGTRSTARFVRVQEARTTTGSAINARNEQTPRVRGVAFDAISLLSACASCLGKVRRARHNGLLSLAAGFRKFLGRHGANLRLGADFGTTGQQRGLRAGELPVGYAQRAGTEHAQVAHGEQPAGAYAGLRFGAIDRHRAHDAALPRIERRDGDGFNIATGCVAEVFDLLNCGPRSRFVVRGIDGRALIVHNCENICQASANDILRHSLRQLDDVVLHIHDEIVVECDEDRVEEMRRVMCTPPPWAEGLPLNVEIKTMSRYGK